MLIGAKRWGCWARLLACVLALVFAIAPVAHLLHPHSPSAHASQIGAETHQHASVSGHDLSHARAASPEEAQGCPASSGQFCADCSFCCHPTFRVVAVDDGSIAFPSAEIWFLSVIPEGVHPDVLPRPPQRGGGSLRSECI